MTAGAARRAKRVNKTSRRTPDGVFLLVLFRQPKAAAGAPCRRADSQRSDFQMSEVRH